MATATDIRKAMGREFVEHQPIKVEAFGTEIKLRTCLSVGDAERILPTLGAFANGTAPMGDLCLKLFEVLATDDAGKPVVEPDDREWFQKSANAGKVVSLINESGVLQKVLDAFAQEDDADVEGKPKP